MVEAVNTSTTSGNARDRLLGVIVSTSVDPGMVEIQPIDGKDRIKTTTLDHSFILAFLNYQAKGEIAVTYIEDGDIATDVTGTGNAWISAVRETEKAATQPVKVDQRIGKKAGKLTAIEDSIFPTKKIRARRNSLLSVRTSIKDGPARKDMAIQQVQLSTKTITAKATSMADKDMAGSVTSEDVRNYGILTRDSPLSTPRPSGFDAATQRQRVVAVRESVVREKETVEENVSDEPSNENLIIAPVPKRVSVAPRWV